MLIIEDMVSRKWITEVVSVEEISTQVELALTAALEASLLEIVDARGEDGLVEPSIDASMRRPTRSCSRSPIAGSSELGV